MKLLIFVALCLLGKSSAYFKFIMEGTSTNIDCVTDGQVLYWFLHGKGEAITATTQGEIYVNTNGTLQFDNVTPDHAGTHLCIATNSDGKINALTTELSVRPLPMEDLWANQYRRMFIVGFISAMVVFVLLGGFCLVNRFRWRDPNAQDKKELVREAYENPYPVLDEDVVDIRM